MGRQGRVTQGRGQMGGRTRWAPETRSSRSSPWIHTEHPVERGKPRRRRRLPRRKADGEQMKKRGRRRRWGEVRGDTRRAHQDGGMQDPPTVCASGEMYHPGGLGLGLLLLFFKRSMSCKILNHHMPSTEKPQRCFCVGKRAPEKHRAVPTFYNISCPRKEHFGVLLMRD